MNGCCKHYETEGIGSGKFICKDGFSPRCRSAGEVAKCPDGTDVDRSLRRRGTIYDGCVDEPVF